MDALTFLQRVLPSSGFYVSVVIHPSGATQQGFHQTVEDLAKALVSLDKRGGNVYYAISAFATRNSRKQENVQATKVIALDVDCGESKPFPTWKEGLVALGDFTSKIGLPKPMVVFSGNGLHAYWVLTEELPPEQWRPIGLALKNAAQQNNFDIDLAVPGDSARVLRCPGTTNRRGNKQAKLLIDAPDCTADELSSALSAYFMPEPASKRPTSGLLDDLKVRYNDPPAKPERLIERCAQVAWGVNNQHDKLKVPEPFWYAMMGIAAYCEDPEGTAVAWSEKHPTYTLAETLAKMAQYQAKVSGPTTCEQFQKLRPSGCKDCKYKAVKIGSPIKIGVQFAETSVSAEAPDKEASTIPLPRPFKRTTDGIKLTIDDTDIDVCKFDLYPVSYGRDEGLGYETVRYHWNRPHIGWQELVLRQAHLTTSRIRDFTTDVADQGIVLYSEKQTEYFQNMLRSYMDELRQRRSLTNLYSTMGWKDNYSQFVIGDTILKRDSDGTIKEESIALASVVSRQGHELWGTAGSQESWVEFTSLLDKADLRAHMFALAVGLSGPLYAFTGLKGLTISLYGPTGGGKSLAQMWVQSLYGNPDKLHFAAKFTQNSLFGRMGTYCHMPLTIDEVTMMDNKEVGDFAYWVSQGRDKARMNRNAEERDAKTWAMPVIVSTNKSMSSKLIASGLDTDAQLARILEVSVPSSPLFSRDSLAGRKIYEFINSNYGHVGRAFIKKLLELGEVGIRAMISEATESFRRKYKTKFTGEERFWEQAILLADLAGRLAQQWELIDFRYEKGIEWVLAQVGAIRRTVTELKVDAFDLLSEYLNENADAALTVTQTGTGKPIVDYARVPRGELRVRFELHRRANGDPLSHGVVLLDRTHFRRWLSTRGADYKTFLNDLQEEHAVATPKSGKAYLGKDSPIKLGQAYVVGVNLSHPRLQGILSDAEQALEDLAFGQLKSV